MSETTAPIRCAIEIDASAAAVWAALTEEARTPLWLGCMRYRPALGAVFYMQPDRAKAAADDIAGATHCEVLALDAPSLFAFSWFLPGFPATRVSFAVEPLGEASARVTLTHDGWEQFPPEEIKPIRDVLERGWRDFVLPGLRHAVEA